MPLAVPAILKYRSKLVLETLKPPTGHSPGEYPLCTAFNDGAVHPAATSFSVSRAPLLPNVPSESPCTDPNPMLTGVTPLHTPPAGSGLQVRDPSNAIPRTTTRPVGNV